MATTDEQLVTAKGLAGALGTVGGSGVKAVPLIQGATVLDPNITTMATGTMWYIDLGVVADNNLYLILSVFLSTPLSGYLLGNIINFGDCPSRGVLSADEYGVAAQVFCQSSYLVIKPTTPGDVGRGTYPIMALVASA